MSVQTGFTSATATGYERPVEVYERLTEIYDHRNIFTKTTLIFPKLKTAPAKQEPFLTAGALFHFTIFITNDAVRRCGIAVHSALDGVVIACAAIAVFTIHQAVVTF